MGWGVLRAWLRERLVAFLLFALCVGVFALIALLLAMPMRAVRYAAILCGAIGLVVAVCDLVSYFRRHAELASLLGCPLTAESMLPSPRGLIAADWRRLLCQLIAESSRREAQSEQAARAQSDYYSLWAHQIKVPIAAMHLLVRNETGQNAAQLNAELFRIEQYVEMTLNYVRMEGGANDYVFREVDVGQVLRQVVRKFAPLFIQKKLRLDLRPETFTALTDEKWLAFAVEQLVSNAIKYTKTGVVTLYADARSNTITVEDTGIGIAPEDLPRVFEQGYTGYNGRNDKRATGLGLYLCREVLTRLGHTVSITSEPGKGTKATVDLTRREVDVE